MAFSEIKDRFDASSDRFVEEESKKGSFDGQELKKFLLLGLILAFITDIYFTLRPMKDAFFMGIVGGAFAPQARMISLLAVFPLVLVFSVLVDKLSRQGLFYALSIVYGSGMLIFAWYMLDPVIGLANLNADPSRILGWAWYVFVDSFGYLSIALFWAFATDITKAEPAQKWFYFIFFIAQLTMIFGIVSEL